MLYLNNNFEYPLFVHYWWMS